MKKSTITCDMEGVILTMNNAAEEIFGYNKDELIGKKRVSIFSPGEVVLQNVAYWLQEAVAKGVYKGKTVFINKSKQKINAKIRITPTFNNGKDKPQTGYCGVTEVIDEEVNVEIKSSTKLIKWLAITRLPFTSVSIFPIIVTACYFAYMGDNLFNLFNLFLCLFGIIFVHLAINVYNDYFDYKDGTDELNNEYFQQISGGSRSIELGLITLKKTKKLALILSLISVIFGLVLMLNVSVSNALGIFVIAKAGFFLGYFYTAPPLRLVSRRGLGELSIFLAFGPLLTLGAGFAIFKGDLLSSEHLLNCILLGVPMGLLTTNILLINQFPDMKSDIQTGKNHLVATFGKKKSRWFYTIILLMSIVTSMYFNNIIINNRISNISSLILLLLGSYIVVFIFKNYKKRSLIKANWFTIYLQAIFCFILLITFLI